jgi:hypothetical protein
MTATAVEWQDIPVGENVPMKPDHHCREFSTYTRFGEAP